MPVIHRFVRSKAKDTDHDFYEVGVIRNAPQTVAHGHVIAFWIAGDQHLFVSIHLQPMLINGNNVCLTNGNHVKVLRTKSFLDVNMVLKDC